MSEQLKCLICGQSRRQLMSAAMVRTTLFKLIQADHPEWNDKSYICLDDLNIYRSRFVANTLEEERGELTNLEEDVIRSLKEQEIIAENANKEITATMSFGDRLSDRIASFGGSWSFLILFGAGMSAWILYNSMLTGGKPIDPFPFILLNLVLSCLAAVQAPVIMMSQNRQELKDRMQAENDYRVNLKAEIEIRQLHSKLDMLLTPQLIHISLHPANGAKRLENLLANRTAIMLNCNAHGRCPHHPSSPKFAQFMNCSSCTKQLLSIMLVLSLACSQRTIADDMTGIVTAEQAEFFEAKIRPVLIQHCYECHSGDVSNPKGGLRLDSQETTLSGGDSGPAIVPGKPNDSHLLSALRYEGFEMPPIGRLPDSVIADFERWILMGAPDPRIDVAVKKATEIDYQKAAEFWAFTPPVRHLPPTVNDASWPRNDIDRFILHTLEEHQMKPAAAADRRTLIRRAYFDSECMARVSAVSEQRQKAANPNNLQS